MSPLQRHLSSALPNNPRLPISSAADPDGTFHIFNVDTNTQLNNNNNNNNNDNNNNNNGGAGEAFASLKKPPGRLRGRLGGRPPPAPSCARGDDFIYMETSHGGAYQVSSLDQQSAREYQAGTIEGSRLLDLF